MFGGEAHSGHLARGGGATLGDSGLAALDSVDDVGSDPYHGERPGPGDPDPEDYVGGWADRVSTIAERHGRTSHVWVQAFHVAEGGEARVRRCLEVALAHGTTRIGVWAFRACEALDIRPERHKLVWRTVGEALRPRSARRRRA